MESGLFQFEIELTTKCNLKCPHCYIGDSNEEMEYDLAKDLLCQADSLKVADVILTGGEPMIWPHFYELIEEAQKYSFRLGMTTNGLLLNKNNIEKMKAFDYIQLSFDYPPGQHIESKHPIKPEVLIEKAKLILENGIRMTFLCTLSKDNVQYLDDIIAVTDGLGIQLGVVTLLPIGRGQNLQADMFAPDEYYQLMQRIHSIQKRRKEEGKIPLAYNCPLSVLVNEEKQERSRSTDKPIIGGCLAGVAACSVHPNGDLLPCPFVRVPAGNLKESSLIDVWFNSEVLNRIRDRRSYDGKCGVCEFTNICGGCRAVSLKLENNLYGSDTRCYLAV